MSEEDLVCQLKDSALRHRAFKILVSTYQKKLYWHIRKIVMSHDDANDIMQNVFVKIWNNIASFREESSLYTWIFRIATNEALTFIGQQKRKSFYSEGATNEYLTANLQADEYFDGTEIQRKLQQAILTLPEKQRLVFNMKYFDEIKYTDMSQILGTSVGALKASYHHAVKKVEDFLNESN